MEDNNQSFSAFSNRTADEKKWAVILHLSPFAGYLIPVAGFIIPLVIWLLKRTESSYLDAQGKEVINFLISFLAYCAVCALLFLVLIGIPLFYILVAGAIALSVIAAIRTSEGVDYKYPLIFRLVK